MRAWKLERRPHVCSLICSPATNPRGGVNGGLSALSGVAPAASLAGVTVARSLAGGTDADRTGVLIRRVGELFAGGAAALFSARVGLTVMGMVWAVRPICPSGTQAPSWPESSPMLGIISETSSTATATTARKTPRPADRS